MGEGRKRGSTNPKQQIIEVKREEGKLQIYPARAPEISRQIATKMKPIM